MTVPEESHALGEWRRRREHVVDPPLLQLADGKPSTWRAGRGERGRLGGLGLNESVDGLAETVGQSRVELGWRVAHGRAAEEVHDARGLGAEGRDPVRGGGRGVRRGDLLHRPTKKPDDSDPDTGGGCGGARLAPRDAAWV